MSSEHVEARRGAYADSVTLMQISTDARKTPGAEAVLVAMATELNLGLLAGMGFPAPAAAGPNDLVVAVRASDEEALAATLAVIEAGLTERPRPAAGPARPAPPRTTAAAIRAAGPGLVLVSVPGRHAFAEAIDALDAGCDVMIFSDNVPVEQEVLLKDIAARRGLLVMGPDCGTAVVGGVGLGFANAVRPGPVGLVAAAGTGAQQVMCLLDAAGAGVSAVLGLGGRDLSAEVGGRSTRVALARLDDDPATDLIVIVSKMTADLRALAAGLRTPVRFAGPPDLTAGTEDVLRTLGIPVPDWPAWKGANTEWRPGSLVGLFAGGTLCAEAAAIVGPGHPMTDFGDDRFTLGRPHPMIDQTLRLEALAAALADPATGAVLVDVVLGYGAHPDPATELAGAFAGAGVPAVASLVGTRDDPQGLERQAAVLASAGAHVFASNAQAARFARDLVG